LSIRSLQHFALAVPDPAVGRRFYEDFGLEGRESGSRVTLSCRGRAQDQVILVEGPRRTMHHISFGTKPELIDGLKSRIEASGTRLLDAPNAAPGEGLWFRDPDGLLVNIKVAEPAPWAPAPEFRLNTPGHFSRIGARAAPARTLEVKPRRLGHVLRFSPNLDRQLDFYTRVLGMRLSDRSASIVAFMHCEGGSDHHVFGFIASDKPGFHHASFEVANVDEIGLGACKLIDKGYRNGWGFGRNVIGSNFFHYVRDPWNSLVEYFSDIDYIPAEQAWEARDWPPEDSLYVWGPAVPEDFGANYEAVD
jgi:catechol 2,3-dioxygenase-like lactoylglutathione lyase family enzyme